MSELRRLVVLLMAAFVVVSCTGEVDPPEVAIESASWSGSQVTVEVTTNLPDGAIISWSVIEGEDEDDWDDIDLAHTNGFATVQDGTATGVADVSGFSIGHALVSVSFIAGYSGQPEEIADAYGPPFPRPGWPQDWRERASDEIVVSRQ